MTESANAKRNVVIVLDPAIESSELADKLEQAGFERSSIYETDEMSLPQVIRSQQAFSVCVLESPIKERIRIIASLKGYEELSDTALIAVVPDSESESIQRLTEAVVHKIIRSPYNAQELSNVVEGALGALRVQQQSRQPLPGLPEVLHAVADKFELLSKRLREQEQHGYALRDSEQLRKQVLLKALEVSERSDEKFNKEVVDWIVKQTKKYF